MKKLILLLTLAALLIPHSGESCTNILVTRGASTDGSTMVTYAADSHTLYGELYFRPAADYPAGTMLDVYEWDTGRYMGRIKQVPHTYQTVGNMNEHQLIIAETTFGGRPELVDSTGIMDYGSLIYLTLQRAKTAREAIRVITDLVAEYGYGSSGESLSIADKDEVWVLEIIGKGTKLDKKGRNLNKGAVWVARRVPEGYITAHANHPRITTIPMNDPENTLYSKDVISFARAQGYYTGTDADFSFSDVYAPLDFSAMRGCEARVWAVFNRLTTGMDKYVDYALGHNPANRMPLWIKPDQKVSPKQVMDLMRDHYEDTPLDMRHDIGAGGHALPYRWRPMQFEVDGQQYVNERAIATQQTGFWFMAQGRNWLPDPIGGVNWFGVDDAGASSLTPIYCGVTSVPECFREGNGDMGHYSPTSAFWLVNRVTNFAYLRWDLVSADILKIVDRHENAMLAEIPGIDAKAAELYKSDPAEARFFLTTFSNLTAQSLFRQWQDLDNYLLVKYIDGNVKHIAPDGSFSGQKSPNGTFYIDFPAQPGYSKLWKEQVARTTGNRLKVVE